MGADPRVQTHLGGTAVIPIPPDWDFNQLLGHPADLWVEQMQGYCNCLESLDPSAPRKLLIRYSPSDPLTFLAWFLAAHLTGFSVFLAQPQWREREISQVLAQIGSVWIPQDRLEYHPASYPEPQFFDPAILIPTGGSSGSIRFAIHTWDTLSASVFGVRSHLGLDSINSLCVLPLSHVSGLMQVMRCLLTRGHVILLPWKTLEQARGFDWDPSGYCLSLVPTQLQRLIQVPRSIPWLTQFRAIFLGGGPSWPQLLDQARSLHLPLALTYGMTETASQITTLKPQEFWAGNTSSGRVLPHAQLFIQDSQGQTLEPGHSGLITIRSQSLALGYYPERWSHSSFQSQDLGLMDPEGYLHLLGRADQLIITGGEKVLATEVEGVIRSSGWVEDVCVVGFSDPEWGQQVIALFTSQSELGPAHLKDRLRHYLLDQLSSYKVPKQWIWVPALPRNQQGKLNRTQILQLAETYLNSSNRPDLNS